MSMKRSGWQLFGMQMACALVCGGALACTQPSEPQTLRVFAASSLVDAFDAIKENFVATHPGVDVRLVYAGSQVLRAQIEQGAQVDVFASAHRRDLDRLRSQNLVAEPIEFAKNRLVLLCRRTPACEQLTWKNLSQVKRIGLGLAATPVGQYTERALELGAQHFGASWAEDVRERVVTQEAQVRRLRARVELGFSTRRSSIKATSPMRQPIEGFDRLPSWTSPPSFGLLAVKIPPTLTWRRRGLMA